MTKIHIAITCLTLMVLAGTSNAEILRCTGEINWNKTTSKKFMGETLRVQLDVVIPAEKDETFSAGLLSKDGKFGGIILGTVYLILWIKYGVLGFPLYE